MLLLDAFRDPFRSSIHLCEKVRESDGKWTTRMRLAPASQMFQIRSDMEPAKRVIACWANTYGCGSYTIKPLAGTLTSTRSGLSGGWIQLKTPALSGYRVKMLTEAIQSIPGLKDSCAGSMRAEEDHANATGARFGWRCDYEVPVTVMCVWKKGAG